MISPILRLPCLKLFCGFPSRIEGNQILDGSLQGPASYGPNPPVHTHSGLATGLLHTSQCPHRASAFAVPLAQGAFPMTRTQLKCHLCRGHLVGDTLLVFCQGTLASSAVDCPLESELSCEDNALGSLTVGIKCLVPCLACSRCPKICLTMKKQNTIAYEAKKPILWPREMTRVLNYFQCLRRG